MAGKSKQLWKNWNPGFSGHHTLGDVLMTLPGSAPHEIPAIVRLVENPASRFSLPGAISLMRHDCLHVILGRGLLPQDEGFVIGFTMGASAKIRRYHRPIFKLISRFLYPSPYQLSRSDLRAFDVGFDCGQTQQFNSFENFPFEDHLDCTIDSLRRRLGINLSDLFDSYRLECSLVPRTEASCRLSRNVAALSG